MASPDYGFATPKVSKMVLLDRSGQQLTQSVDRKLSNHSVEGLRLPRKNVRTIAKINGKYVDNLWREQMGYHAEQNKPMATVYGHDFTWNGSEKQLSRNIFMDTSSNLQKTHQSASQKALSGHLIPASQITANLNLNHRKTPHLTIDQVRSPGKAPTVTISSDRNPAEAPSPSVQVPVITQSEVVEKRSEPETRKSFDPAMSTVNDIRTHKFGQTKLDDLGPADAQRVDKELCGLVEGICLCGKCKWPYHPGEKVVYKEYKSIYNQDYDPKKRIDNSGRLTADFYSSTPQGSGKMELTSTMRSDYRVQPPVSTASMKPYDGINANIPLAAVSSYQASFINYGANAVFDPKVSRPLTIIPELPFINRTTYRENFTTKNLKAERAKAPPSNPIASHLPMVGESLYQVNFKPFKLGTADLNTRHREDPGLTPAFDGQFVSENRKTLTNPERRKCPARTIIEELAKTSHKGKTVLSTLH